MPEYSITIFQSNDYIPMWYNFTREVSTGKNHKAMVVEEGVVKAVHRVLADRYKGKVIGGTIFFESEQDKMWFVLNWS